MVPRVVFIGILAWVTMASAFTLPGIFTTTMLPRYNTSGLYWLGQEIRVKISAVPFPTPYDANASAVITFNHTGGLKAKVIAAYTNQSMSGHTQQVCNDTTVDPWVQYNDLGSRMSFDGDKTTDAYFTFTVPPFPFKLCFSAEHVNDTSTVWDQFDQEYIVHRYNEAPVFYDAPTQMNEGDYAAIIISKRGTAFPYEFTVPPSRDMLYGDNVKLVPAGYPCTYEKAVSRDNTTTNTDYCGTNKLLRSLNGRWMTDDCVKEGSVAMGVGKVGSPNINPFVDEITPEEQSYWNNDTIVAYFRLPAAGTYDICYSSMKHRQAVMTTTPHLSDAAPVWMKIPRWNTTGCGDTISSTYQDPATCFSHTFRLNITARNTSAPMWWSHDVRALSWGSIRVGFNESTLSSAKATAWDPKCYGCAKQYANTTGGDIFRIVPATSVADVSATSTGNLGDYTLNNLPQYNITAQTSLDYGNDTTTINYLANPPYGSVPNSGCWDSSLDNYGSSTSMNAAPHTCSTCDTGTSGVTASGDLGGDPRRGTAAYALDETSQNETFAFVRFPPPGSYYVCYKQAGVNNWRWLYIDANKTDSVGHALAPHMDFHNYTYTLNDTTADTLGQFHVSSGVVSKLTTMKNNYTALTTWNTNYTAEGAHMKVVSASESCADYQTGLTGADSNDPGIPECAIGVCTTTNCTECHGRLHNSTTLRRSVTFFLKIPSYTSSYYRLCFRNRDMNWVELGKDSAMDEQTMTIPEQFRPRARPTMYAELSDTRTGSLGRFHFFAGGNLEYNYFDLRPYDGVVGTVVRLVRNTTVDNGAVVSPDCDLTWADIGPQQYNASLIIPDLGQYCVTSTTGDCTSTTINPSDSGVLAMYPYSAYNRFSDESHSAYAVGFLPKLPDSADATLGGDLTGWKVCVRTGSQNWFELDQTIATSPDPQFYIPSGLKFLAGEYANITISSVSQHMLDFANVVVKLVSNVTTCDQPAVGTHVPGNSYVSMTTATTWGSMITNSTDYTDTTGANHTLLAWLTMPTLGNTTIRTDKYFVCMATAKSSAVNWINLGEIEVESVGVMYTVQQKPMNGGALQVDIITFGEQTLNTTSGGDSAKVVPYTSPCHGNVSVPTGVTSTHVGIEMDIWSATSEQKTLGILDVGPQDEVVAARGRLRITLPHQSGATLYKVCYKLYGKDWMEIEQAPVVNRVYNLGTTGLLTADPVVTSFTDTSNIKAQEPNSTWYYYNLSYTSLVVSGASTAHAPSSVSSSGSSTVSYYFYVSGSALSSTDELKLVPYDVETVMGKWSRTQQDTCFGANYEGVYTPKATSTSKNEFEFNMPIVPGRYIACYKVTGTTAWQQLNPSSTSTTNPIIVIDSRLEFNAGTSLAVSDYFTNNSVSYGSMMSPDRVYVTNSTGTCGILGIYNGSTDIATNAGDFVTSGISSTSYYSTMTANASYTYPVSGTSAYKICYYKSQSSATSASDVIPFVQSGIWYQIPSRDFGRLSILYRPTVTTTTVSATCPPYNATQYMDGGVAFDVPVKIVDSEGLTVPSTSFATEISAVAVSGGFTLKNTAGSCVPSQAASYGWHPTNLILPTGDGSAQFSLVVQSTCLGSNGVCDLKFTAPGSTDSQTCSFRVASTTVSRLSVLTGATSCNIGTACQTTFAGHSADERIAYSNNDQVTAQMSLHPGVAWKQQDGTLVPANGILSTRLANGTLDLNLVPVIGENANQWAEGLPQISVSITVTHASALVTHTFTLNRPVLSQVFVTEVTAVNWDGTPATDAASNLIPKWEPFASHRNSYWPHTGATDLSSAPNYYLEAGQYYKVTLEAADALGRTMPDVNLIDKATTINMTFITTLNNLIIGQPSAAADAEDYEQPVPLTRWTSVKQEIVFRIKNSNGCARATGCKLEFKFGGKSFTSSITTPVRSIATQLRVSCYEPSLGSTSALVPLTTCQGEVPNGVSIQVEAIDFFGNVDEYFTGAISAVMEPLPSIPKDVYPTTTSKLTLVDATALPALSATNGVALWRDFTLSKPCTGCGVLFVSDWGAQMGLINVTAPASTTRLSCPISGTYYLLDTTRQSVVGTVDFAKTNEVARTAVYEDTMLCFAPEAVDSLGKATLYESLWVSYRVIPELKKDAQNRTVGSYFVSAVPSHATPYRVRTLKFSKSRFCFNVTGEDGAKFSVHFQAQKFLNSWSAGANGLCTTPVFTFSAKKFIGGVRVKSFEGSQFTAVTGHEAPSTNFWSYAQQATLQDEFQALYRFEAIDHYGNPIASTQLHSTQTSFYVSVSSCTQTNLDDNVCQPSTGQAQTSGIVMSSLTSITEGGLAKASVVSHSAALTSDSTFLEFTITRFCLKCSLEFSVYKDLTPFTDAVSGIIRTTAFITVLMPDTATRYVAFPPASSPWKPTGNIALRGNFITSHWQHWMDSTGAQPTDKTRPVVFYQPCHADSSCKPQDSLFLSAICDEQEATGVIDGPNGGIAMYVLQSTTTLAWGEPWCFGSCTSREDSPQAQVDIFNSYDISVSIGTQRLSCTGKGCANDFTTSVTQTISAQGTTIDAALKNLAAFKTTSFTIAGVDPSDYYATSGGTLSTTSGPSMKGAFTAKASTTTGTGSVTSITTDKLGSFTYVGLYEFAWMGPKQAHRIALSSVAGDTACLNKPTYAAAQTSANYDGYPFAADLSTIAFDYTAQDLSSGVMIPFSVEVQDVNSKRVYGASGTVAVQKVAWYGCNNGGTLTVQEGTTTIVNGRATVWLQFSEPCQSCVLEFTVTPDSNQLTTFYTSLQNPSLLKVRSVPVSVRDIVNGQATTALVTTDATTQASAVAIDTLISARVQSYVELGRLVYADTVAPLTIRVYNRITSTTNLVWVGNGGILRPSVGSLNHDRHAVVASGKGAAAVTFAFQRTCQGCEVIIAWSLSSTGKSASVALRNANGVTFVVTAPNPVRTLVGYKPRYVGKGNWSAASMWSMGGTDLIPNAGVDATALSGASTASVSVVSGRNGNGGTFSSFSILGTNTESVVFKLTEPCVHCSIRVAQTSFDLLVGTVATHYRVESITPTIADANEDISFRVYASDDQGYQDVLVGGYSLCQFRPKFFCGRNAAISIGAAVSGNGRTEGGFQPQLSFYNAGGPLNTNFKMNTRTTTMKITDGETISPAIINFDQPIHRAYPIFSDSNGLTSASFPTFYFSVDVGLTDLQLATDKPGVDAEVGQILEIKVAFVKQQTSATASFVAARADNMVVLTLTGECNVDVVSGHEVRMFEGVALFKLLFISKSVGRLCNAVFTTTSESGRGSCTAPLCSTQSDIRAVDIVATSWDFVEPNLFDNQNATLGPKYAAQGTSQPVVVQLYEIIPTSGTRKASVCSSSGAVCFFTMQPQGCLPLPDIIPPGGNRFDANGTARIEINWKLNRDGNFSGYSCEMLSVVSGATVDGPLQTRITIDACYPTSFRVMTNTSSHALWSRSVTTGQSYPLEVEVLDTNGVRCIGDSQNSIATEFTLDVVDARNNPVSGISVVNVNMTTLNTTIGPKTYSTKAQAVAGTFMFQLVFTNSTANAGVRHVKVRIQAVSTSFTSTLYTDLFQIVIAPYQLRMRKLLPRHWVGKNLYNTSVEAVDAVPDEWLRNTGNAPNIIASSTPKVRMVVSPAFRAVVPMRFYSGAATTTLSKGIQDYSFAWTGIGGTYNYTFIDTSGRLKPTGVYRMSVQQPKQFQIITRGFRPLVADRCTADCTLPSTLNETLIDGVTYLEANSTVQFNVSVAIVDVNGNAVIGHDNTVIGARLIDTVTRGNSSLQLRQAPTLVRPEPLEQPLNRGETTFKLGFVGTNYNLNETMNYSHAVLEFYCADHTCGATSSISSMPVRIDALYSSPEILKALQNYPVIKVPTTLTSLTGFDKQLLQSTLVSMLQADGHYYIGADNAEETIQVTSCETYPILFKDADLRNSTCGASQACTTADASDCPAGVRVCTCPALRTSVLNYRRSFQILQNITPAPPEVRVQVEIGINLQNAVAFAGTSVSDIERVYGLIANAIVIAIRSSAAFDFLSVDRNGVGLVFAGSPAATALQTDPPVTFAPLTPSPPFTASPMALSAPATYPYLAVVVACVVVALLQLVF